MPNIFTRPVLRHMCNTYYYTHMYLGIYTCKIESFWKRDYCKELQSLELKWKYWDTEQLQPLVSTPGDWTHRAPAERWEQLRCPSRVVVTRWGTSRGAAGQAEEMPADRGRLCSAWEWRCDGFRLFNADSWKHLLDWSFNIKIETLPPPADLMVETSEGCDLLFLYQYTDRAPELRPWDCLCFGQLDIFDYQSSELWRFYFCKKLFFFPPELGKVRTVLLVKQTNNFPVSPAIHQVGFHYLTVPLLPNGLRDIIWSTVKYLS